VAGSLVAMLWPGSPVDLWLALRVEAGTLLRCQGCDRPYDALMLLRQEIGAQPARLSAVAALSSDML
jgi:hypothetical protein